MTIIAAADGSALGNPGPAGWAWYVDDSCWHAGGWPHGTNNRGELMAVIDLLESTAHRQDDVHVLCDSQYVINAVTKWMPGWKRKGWRKADGQAVLNRDLLERLDAALAGRAVSFEWVKGHAGHELNEAADERARAVATAYQSGAAVPAGPGFPGAARPASAPTGAEPAGAAVALNETQAAGDRDEAVALFDLAEAPVAACDAVMVLERRLLDPAVRSDPSEVASLLHPDFEEIGASGRVWDRDTAIAALGETPAEGAGALECTLLGDDVALVRYRTAGSERSSLWLRSGGRWRLRHHQGTPAS